MALPPFTEEGDLPVGVHPATLSDVLERFGVGSPQRRTVASRLERIVHLARSTGHLARLIVFGSFVTDEPDPNDVDLFFLMEDSFDASQLTGEEALLFDHSTADALFGASVFWLRRLAAWEGEEAAVRYWQVKRDHSERGIVEIIREQP
jgi:hypothetical protein